MSIEEFKQKIISILTERKLTKEQLRKAISFKGEENQDRFEEVLKGLENEGKVYLNDKGFYNVFNNDIELIQGRIIITSDGIGHFTGQKEGKTVKFRIQNKHLNGALTGDIVLVSDRHLERYDRKLGKVERVFQRNKLGKKFVYLGHGIFQLYSNISEIYLRLDEKDCEGLVYGSLIIAETDEKPVVDTI